MKRTRKHFSAEIKKQAVEEYVSGKKDAAKIAAELGIDRGLIYKWRVELHEGAKGARVAELEAQGISATEARRILNYEAVIEEYQKKVAEQAIMIDLLKKLQTSTAYQSESELTGLINTSRRLARSKRLAK